MESHSQEYVLGQGAVDQSQPWNSLQCSLASIPPEIMDSSSDDLWLLPEMSIQPTITAEAEVFCDLNRENANHGKQTHSEGIPTGEQQGDQLRRTRSAGVHKTSERTRRDRINRKVKALQELIPHCKKKDKASILQDAAEYMRTLQLQVETMMMMNAQGGVCGTPCVPVLPMIPGIGSGIGAPYGTGMLGVGCSAQYAPIFRAPLPSVAFGPSMPATPIAAFKGSPEQVLEQVGFNPTRMLAPQSDSVLFN